jgi:hypothetical protein
VTDLRRSRLLEATRGKDWRDILRSHKRYCGQLFDYAAEGEYLS